MSSSESFVSKQQFRENVIYVFKSFDAKLRMLYKCLVGLALCMIGAVLTVKAIAPNILSWHHIFVYTVGWTFLLVLPHHAQTILLLEQERRKNRENSENPKGTGAGR